MCLWVCVSVSGCRVSLEESMGTVFQGHLFVTQLLQIPTAKLPVLVPIQQDESPLVMWRRCGGHRGAFIGVTEEDMCEGDGGRGKNDGVFQMEDNISSSLTFSVNNLAIIDDVYLCSCSHISISAW